MAHILIIEDDPAILMGLRDALSEEHFHVESEADGARGYEHALRESFDCIILDLMLPSMNGRDICKKLRDEGVVTPIIMLTSKGEESDKVLGLELGADDYVTKPFSIRELIARIRAHLRRTQSPAQSAIHELRFGKVHILFDRLETFVDSVEVKLSSKELAIMKYFAAHEGVAVTREMLLDEVWGYENFPTTRTVDNYILTIRKKLEENPAEPKHILTLHTLGYKFVR